MQEPEFKKGDVVTFQAYVNNEPIKREVLDVSLNDFWGKSSDSPIYHLGHKNSKGEPIVTNVTRACSIVESCEFFPI